MVEQFTVLGKGASVVVIGGDIFVCVCAFECLAETTTYHGSSKVRLGCLITEDGLPQGAEATVVAVFTLPSGQEAAVGSQANCWLQSSAVLDKGD